MNRKEFIKICGLFGISAPLPSFLLSCNNDDDISKAFSGKVIIIGAGAGGLSAGYFLKQKGIDFEILEASNTHGGRMRINTDFADFPIPLGSEWLETKPSVLQEIVNNSAVSVNVETVSDNPDYKFVNYSWYSFFNEFIFPSVSNNIVYNTIVQAIDYSAGKIIINTNKGQFEADKVVLSVPLKVLQEGDILFTPSLPQNKADAIKNAPIWDGFKAFFEFSTNFYGEGIEVSNNHDGEKIYYNASFGQNTNKNILGLFTVGAPAKEFFDLSDEQIKEFILNELDAIYNKQASPNYRKHISQNWSKEPFIKGGYLSDHAEWKTVRELGNSIAEKLYFAGGEYTDGEDWVSVHTAAQAALRAVNEISA